MSALGKLVMGAMGALHPRPPVGDAVARIDLPPPDLSGDARLLDSLGKRRSTRAFRRDALPLGVLSTLLWAADGVNRADGGRTAPSALGAKEIDIVVALPSGAYRFDAQSHTLQLICAQDVRRLTGYQDFVDDAPLDLVYIADHARMKMVPASQREAFASVAAGAIAQNVYLFAASAGIGAVLRAWIDRAAIARALGLTHDQQVLLSQTVGFIEG